MPQLEPGALPDDLRSKIARREPFDTGQTVAYLTPGGTYMIASGAILNDDDQMHDLVAVTRGGGVHPVRYNVNPAFVRWLEPIVRP